MTATDDEVVAIFIIILVVFIFVKCLQNCCSNEDTSERTRLIPAVHVRDYGAPVVVTSATHTATVSQMAQPANVYAAPYPTAESHMTSGQLPMPHNQAQLPPAGFLPHAVPYSPYPSTNMSAGLDVNPPSYDAVMANSATGATAYEKQLPYNPHY